MRPCARLEQSRQAPQRRHVSENQRRPHWQALRQRNLAKQRAALSAAYRVGRSHCIIANASATRSSRSTSASAAIFASGAPSPRAASAPTAPEREDNEGRMKMVEFYVLPIHASQALGLALPGESPQIRVWCFWGNALRSRSIEVRRQREVVSLQHRHEIHADLSNKPREKSWSYAARCSRPPRRAAPPKQRAAASI